MTCWEILGVSPTKEVKAIKKAYAAKLRQLNPDEEPAAFQRLKEAFDAALRFAREDEIPELEGKEALPLQLADDFPAGVQGFLAEQAYFDDLAGWQRLLAGYQEWRIEDFMRYSLFIQQVLFEYFMYLSKPVIALLFETFQLADLESDFLGHQLGYGHFLQIRPMIQEAPDFDFSFWRALPQEAREAYFAYRYQYYAYLNQEAVDAAKLREVADAARLIYDADGDFVLLEAMAALVAAKGDLKVAGDLVLVKAEARPPGNQRLYTFLTLYQQVWETKHVEDMEEALLDSAGGVPPVWQHFLLGRLFFQVELPSAAFRHWRQASGQQLRLLAPYLKHLRRHLNRNELKQYKALAIFHGLAGHERRHRGKAKTYLLMIAAGVALVLLFARITYDESPELPVTFSAPEINAAGGRTLADFVDEDADSVSRFVYYYLCNENEKERQTFIDEFAAENGAELLRQNINDAPATPEATSYHYYYAKDYTATDGLCQVIYHNAKAQLIVKLDEDERIIDILGDGWNNVDAATFEALLEDIAVRPSVVLNFFIYQYLPSEDRLQAVANFPQYLTPEVKALLENRAEEAPDEKYAGGFWQKSRFSDEEYLVIYEDENAPGMLLQFDDYGRLAGIYLDGWQEMAQEKVDKILANCTGKRQKLL